jgi:hypothetical protein
MKTETGITNIVTHMYISNPISPATAITMMVNNLVDKLHGLHLIYNHNITSTAMIVSIIYSYELL